MKVFIFFIMLLCSSNLKSEESVEINDLLGEIISSTSLRGAILIYDLKEQKYITNDSKWAVVKRLPASTFKVPNTLIALDEGIVTNINDTIYWDGNPRRFKSWESNLSLKEAFHLSCVPCYQEIAKKIGVDKMIERLNGFGYGDMTINSDNIDKFWLEGSSRISQFGQIEFLRKLYFSTLPAKMESMNMLKALMIIEENSQYSLYGKTGWAVRNGENNGWFVGWLKREQDVYFFAVNVDPNETFDMKLFNVIRKEIALKAFATLGIIDE